MIRFDVVRFLIAVAYGHTEHCAARISFGDGECECKRSPLKPLDSITYGAGR